MLECEDCGSIFDVTFYEEEQYVRYCPCCGEEFMYEDGVEE